MVGYNRSLGLLTAIARTQPAGVIYSLQREVRGLSKIAGRTPLTRQKSPPGANPIVATSIAAGVEAFYRSGMNAYINSHLMGTKVAKLFPDMHVQVRRPPVEGAGFISFP